MKTMKTVALSALIATSSVLSAGAFADTVLFVYPGNESVKAQVHLDGKPAEGAQVQVYNQEGKLKKEAITSKYGYVNFAQLEANEPVKLVATTAGGETDSKWVMPRDSRSQR